MENKNVFKHDPGVGGLVLAEDGTPVEGALVKVYLGNSLYSDCYTDEDGWYMCDFKYTGKPVTFTVKTNGYDDQTVTLRANSFALVTFDASKLASATQPTDPPTTDPPTSPSKPGKGKK